MWVIERTASDAIVDMLEVTFEFIYKQDFHIREN